MCIPRPYRCHKITAVLALTKIPVFHAFLIDLIPLLYLHSRINNRNQSQMILLHPLHKLREIRKILRMQRKILIILHIVNIHIDHIYRDMILTIPLCYLIKVLLSRILPATLPIPKRKFRRNITPPDHLTKLPYNLIRTLSLDHIQIQIRLLTTNLQRIHPRISNIKRHLRRIVHKQTKRPHPRHHQKIMRPIQTPLILRMLRNIRIVTNITISPLINPPVRLSKPIDHILIPKPVSPRKPLTERSLPILRHPLFRLHL